MKAAVFLLPCVLSAQGIPDSLATRLKAPRVLHADFKQTRHIRALSRPLQSSGTFLVVRNKGVLWRMEKPLPLTVVAGPKGLVEIDGAGHRKAQSAQDAPMAARMAGIMKSLLEGDLGALASLFTAKADTAPGGSWTVTLTPLPATAAFVKSVRIQGSTYVESLLLTEASGDTTEIAFSRFRPEAPVTPEEQSLLGPE